MVCGLLLLFTLIGTVCASQCYYDRQIILFLSTPSNSRILSSMKVGTCSIEQRSLSRESKEMSASLLLDIVVLK